MGLLNRLKVLRRDVEGVPTAGLLQKRSRGRSTLAGSEFLITS